jgi:hypothetical protein
MAHGQSPYRHAPPTGRGTIRDNVIYRAGSLHEAALVVDALAESGISARVLNEHLAGSIGELPHGQILPEVWILDGRERQAAERIVTEFRAREASAIADDVTCPACGEDNPGNFEICWACAADLAGV